jgi:hypothetical protein
MNDFIFNIQPQAQSLLFGQPWDAFLPPLVGSFFGVLAGFGINYAYQSYKTNRDKKTYIKMIKSEIEDCISVLNQNIVQSLPEDKWMSAVNSGTLRLFNLETELQPLGKVYYKIHDYNEKALMEKFIGYDWPRLEREDGCRLPANRVYQILQRRESLKRELTELKNAEWLNPTGS